MSCPGLKFLKLSVLRCPGDYLGWLKVTLRGQTYAIVGILGKIKKQKNPKGSDLFSLVNRCEGEGSIISHLQRRMETDEV